MTREEMVRQLKEQQRQEIKKSVTKLREQAGRRGDSDNKGRRA